MSIYCPNCGDELHEDSPLCTGCLNFIACQGTGPFVFYGSGTGGPVNEDMMKDRWVSEITPSELRVVLFLLAIIFFFVGLIALLSS
jgi:hypothetical protein